MQELRNLFYFSNLVPNEKLYTAYVNISSSANVEITEQGFDLHVDIDDGDYVFVLPPV